MTLKILGNENEVAGVAGRDLPELCCQLCFRMGCIP